MRAIKKLEQKRADAAYLFFIQSSHTNALGDRL